MADGALRGNGASARNNAVPVVNAPWPEVSNRSAVENCRLPRNRGDFDPRYRMHGEHLITDDWPTLEYREGERKRDKENSMRKGGRAPKFNTPEKIGGNALACE